MSFRSGKLFEQPTPEPTSENSMLTIWLQNLGEFWLIKKAYEMLFHIRKLIDQAF